MENLSILKKAISHYYNIIKNLPEETDELYVKDKILDMVSELSEILEVDESELIDAFD